MKATTPRIILYTVVLIGLIQYLFVHWSSMSTMYILLHLFLGVFIVSFIYTGVKKKIKKWKKKIKKVS